jgi:SAM-dependent methyltransferase
MSAKQQFFSTDDCAARYNRYRPMVHSIVLHWLGKYYPTIRFKRVVDVACGTGDSAIPLLEIADELYCVDKSPPMLNFAKTKGLSTYHLDYCDLSSLGKFDLLSTCMGFHWFDPVQAIASYKSASNNGAIWLIYNFHFIGLELNQDFNTWLKSIYKTKFPSPSRNKAFRNILNSDNQLIPVGSEKGSIPIQFSLEELVGYLMTQSNVESAVQRGENLMNIEGFLTEELEKMDLSSNCQYGYEYDLFEFRL